jgi:hypothetical protein
MSGGRKTYLSGPHMTDPDRESMSGKRLKIGIACAVFIGGLAAIVLESRSNARLRAENDRLRGESRDANHLRDENARLTQEMQKMKAASGTRGAVSPARAAGSGAAPGGAGDRARAQVPLAAGLVPIRSLKNAGRGSARDAFETQLWAARNGDIALTASAITFGPEARAKMEAILAQLPESTRETYGTPESLMAFVLAGSPHPVGGMQVLGEDDTDADNAVLHTQWQHEDDTVVHDTDAQLQRTNDGWQVVIPTVLVDRAGAYLLRHSPP